MLTDLLANPLLLVLLVAVLALLGWNFWQSRQIKKIMERSREIYGSNQAAKVETVLSHINDHFKKNDHEITELQDVAAKIFNLANISLQKVGLVRFNPFGDVGSDQSFSIALLDHRNNGIIFSSLHSREGTRVYAKPVKKAGSDYPLSDEEKQAIAKACGQEKD